MADPLTATHHGLAGGGEMGARIRAHDWAATPLGPIAGWPSGLRTTLSLSLESPTPIWIGWGPDCRFFYNDAYIQVLGRSKHPWALGRPAAEVWAEIWHVCGPMVDRVFGKGEAPAGDGVQLFMNRGDRLEEVYYSFSYSPIRGERDEVVGLFCPNNEVTAKILSARRMRTLFELSARGLVERTPAQACDAAAHTLGRNPHDVPFAALYLVDGAHERLALEHVVGVAAGTALTPAVVPLDVPQLAAWPLAEVFATARARIVDVPRNEVIPLALADQPVTEAVISPVTVGGLDRPLGVLVAGVNPTRALDDEYRAFYEMVAGHVGTALHAAHAAEQERRRADMLAELDRAKTTFFSNVSHEFRTPLTLMIGPTEDALAAGAGGLSGEALETVYRNELRLLKLVNALLDFSRLEAGRMVASYQAVDLAALTADLASSFRAAIERAGLTFEVDAPALATPVAIDVDMWEKIVLNLLSNALKFTRAGGVRVVLRARGERVELRVVDTGTGIPASELPRLFERFHRVDNPLARTHEGTGIGLALVHELARLHGGDVTVDSELGRGSEFVVSIPLDPARLAAATASPVARAARTAATFVDEAQRWTPDVAPSTHAAGTAHVLLADDNADMRAYVARLLGEHWRVTAVADGAAALDAARRERPDLVLSDVMMPGLDGFGLLAALRADERTRGVPVILLSARAGDEARVEGLGAGADDYLVKPFSARELIARVRTHLALGRLVAEQRELAEAAGEASRAKDAFLAMLGHELRNPLAPILTAVELTKLRGGEPTRELQTIERQVRHLIRLVDDLLDVSRVTRGLVELARERIPLADVISKALEIASPLIAQRRHAVTVDVQDGLVVDADPVRLAQVFANLLTNAARYTPPGGHITVLAIRDGERVVTRVVDDGVGIAPDLLGRIFELFVQGDRGAARTEGGLGVGLALVRALTALHGGSVTGHSVGPGHGSTFVVELPIAAAPAVTAPGRAIVAPPPRVGRRVLVVDDNVDAAELLGEALSGLGHEVAIAHDGAQALVLVEGFRPEVAVLDLGLPVMDGYELAHQLRERGHACRLIAVTGYGQAQDRARTAGAGFDAHLVKPIELRGLAAEIEHG